MPIYLDPIDVGILRLMQQNARLTNKEIGNILKRSPSAIFDRIKKLQDEKVIKGYTIIINHEEVSSSLISHTHVQLKNHAHEALQEFERTMETYSEVLECANITGKFDYLLKVVVADMRSYHHFVRTKLGALPNIGSIQTSTVLSESKLSAGYPIDSLNLL